MSTGYTANIKKGISFKTFALDCAKAFGACITMRDEKSDTPIPKFKPSIYHREQVKKIREKIELLENMDVETANTKAKKDYDKQVNRLKELILETNELHTKYLDMLVKVDKWQPPHDHNNLKDFMKTQIQESIKHDCDDYYEKGLKSVRLFTGIEWLDQKKREAIRDLEYYNKEDKKEKERVEGRNKWIRELRESLDRYENKNIQN